MDAPAEVLRRALVAAVGQAPWLEPLVLEHVKLALDALRYSLHSPRACAGGLASWQVRLIESIVMQDLEVTISTDRMAKACSLSRSHFSRSFKQSFGLSPHQWVRSQRIEKAKSFLANHNLRLAEVALTCGFTDQSHFSRVFKAHTRITPLAWRRTVVDAAPSSLP